MTLLYATPAHRGRGKVHLAPPHAQPTDPRDPGWLRLATSAVCGSSTAATVFCGTRIPSVVRPGESIALTPTCLRCLAYATHPYPTPGRPIPRTQ